MVGIVCFYLRNTLVLLPSFCRPFAVFDSKGIGEAYTAYRFYANLNLYSVHLETQFFLPPVSPMEGTEIGLTGGRKKTKYKMGSKVNAMQKNRKGFAPFPENS